jgi:hypothetical protein
LEDAPVFTARDAGGDAPARLSLRRAKRAGTNLFLLDGYPDRAVVSRGLAMGAVCLKGHSIVEGVLRAYGLTWQDDGALEDLVLGNQRIVSSALRKTALDVGFSAGVWKGQRLEFPIHGRRPLVLDFELRLVRGPVGEEGQVELAFDCLRTADIDHQRVMGDTKNHDFYYLHLSDGEASMVYTMRTKEYFEHCNGLADMYESQDLAVRVIHAIPAALGVRPRLACPNSVPASSLRELL